MTLRWAAPLVLMLVSVSLPAAAQFGGMPGMPGSPGFGAPQQGPPPGCQQLLALRDDTQKHGMALQAAGQKRDKTTPDEACKLFKAFLAAESRMIKGMEEHATLCGVPPEVIKQVKTSHARAGQAGKNVCDQAAQGPRPAGPTLSDALGATPTVPEAPKRGMGTFDTLTGSPLGR